MQKAYHDTNQGFVGISARKQVTDFRLWGEGGGGGVGGANVSKLKGLCHGSPVHFANYSP